MKPPKSLHGFEFKFTTHKTVRDDSEPSGSTRVPHAIATVSLSLDLEEIARTLGHRALQTRSKKAKALYGLIKAQIIMEEVLR